MPKPTTNSNLLRACVFLFCASLAACQAAFGDYKTGQVGGSASFGAGGHANVGGVTSQAGGGASKASGGGTTGGGTAANSCNSEGAYRCTDTAIEICRNGLWHSYQPCSSDLCDAQHGRCMTCAPGSNRCSAFNLQTCSSAGDSWATTTQCDTAEYCDSVSNRCFACLAGEAFCDGAALYKCNSTQSGWNVVECDSSDLCDARAQTCQACSGSDWLGCNGSALLGCKNGIHVQLAGCGSSQLCQQTLDEHTSSPTTWNGKCVTGCKPGTYQCNPDNLAELRACSPSGTWESVETCLTPELCDAANQKCDTGCGVPPGTYKCDGAQLELCKADGTDFELLKTCQDANHCNTQQHDCVACVPGEFQCSNATLQSCGPDLTLSAVKTCASVALCDATHGKCIEPGCSQAGAYHCNAAVLQQCPTDLTSWTDNQTCANANLCDAANGRCITPECLYPNSYRCQGNTRQICDDATRKWLDANTCVTGQICDLTDASGCLGTCPAVPARCNTVGTQTDAQVCTLVKNLPQWQTVQTCATAALCNVGDAGASCATPACTADQYSCDGNTLKHCNTGRSDWDTVTTCAAGQVCDATGRRCDVCTPNTYTCNSILQLLKCSADGQLNTVVDNCPGANLCYTSTDKLSGHCIRCAVGDTQCSGVTQIQSCLADRSGWDIATTCANGCQDNPGNADYCAACPTAGEVQCVQTSAPGSTRTCSSDRKSWGSTTACAKGLGCVNSGTADYCSDVCTPNASECLAGIGTPGSSLTGKHTCSADGKGWGSTTSECLDSSNLKTCVSGVLTTTKTTCPTNSPYCVNGQCVACTGTSTKCDTATTNTLLTCNNGTWNSSACTGSNNVCSNGACVACTSASSATCPTTATRRYCASNNTWATSTCATVDSTKPYCENGTCNACLSSYTPICTDSNTKVQSCSSGALVKTTCSGATPVCYAGSAGAVCAACNDSTTPVCLSDGVTRKTCVNGSFAQLPCTDANATYCLNGACAGCNAGAPTNCPSNTTVKTCNSSGTWVTTTCSAPTPVCGGSPSACVQCNDSSLFKCSGSSAVSTTRHSCVNNLNVDDTCPTGQVCYPATSTTADATCSAPACAVNEYKCTGKLLQKCNSSRTGWDQVNCSASQSCNATNGTCDAIICTAGTFQCTNNSLQTCNSTGTAWATTTTCTSGQVCNATAGTCDAIICSANTDKKCSNNTLQTCNANGTGWVSTTACTTSQVCNATAGTCDAVVCTANTQKKCTGNTLEVCNSTGTGWVDTACTTSQVCNATAGTCDAVVCTANTQKKCTGNTLEVCNSTGTGWVDTACTTGQVCNATAGTCDAVVCTANQLSCADNTPQICNSTLTGWVANGATCAGATPLCSAGSCVACATSADCSGKTPVCALGVCLACTSDSDCSGGTCKSNGSCG